MDKELIEISKKIVDKFKNKNGNWWANDINHDKEIIMLYLAAEAYLDIYN